MKIIDGSDVTLSYEGGSQIRCIDVTMNSKSYPLWQDFPTEEEDNWANLDDDDRREMTDQLVEAILKGKVGSLWLSMEPYMEDHFLNVEFAEGWAAFLYNDSENEIFCMPYNADYSEEDGLCPVDLGGQTPVLKMNALEDMELTARIVRHFLENGQLCPGTKWVMEE